MLSGTLTPEFPTPCAVRNGGIDSPSGPIEPTISTRCPAREMATAWSTPWPPTVVADEVEVTISPGATELGTKNKNKNHISNLKRCHGGRLRE